VVIDLAVRVRTVNFVQGKDSNGQIVLSLEEAATARSKFPRKPISKRSPISPDPGEQAGASQSTASN
jgi:hypothetical protein